ncbi:acyl carrier protein [Paraburkholderia sp. GAS348]|uniref:acyl carrier protein n=1 Tax=Paraburkholderia sp. GAS348 TaxID=3035132 RepID=UPI003D24BC71
MLQLPVTSIPVHTGALSPLSPATDRSADGVGDGGSQIERLLASAQDKQDTSTQQLSMHLDQLASSSPSTIDMLRFQANMSTFMVQVQMVVRVSDEVGRAIQTLTQRS